MLRRALPSPSRIISRSLGTAVQVNDVTYPTDPETIMKWSKTMLKDLQSQSFKATPITNPIYLAMSPSLVQKKSYHPPHDSLVELNPTVFDHPIRRDILHLCVVHHLDSLRQGSASTKTRGEVRGSGIKIRPQKGSGRARLGDGQSPMLRGGGVAFGPKPRDFSTKLPRKVIEMGMRVALSAKVKERRLGLVQNHEWPCGKTNPLAHRIDFLGWRKTLLVTGQDSVPVGLERAGRNLEMFGMTTADKLNVYDVVKWQRLVMDVAAVDYFDRTLGKNLPVAPSPV